MCIMKNCMDFNIFCTKTSFSSTFHDVLRCPCTSVPNFPSLTDRLRGRAGTGLPPTSEAYMFTISFQIHPKFALDTNEVLFFFCHVAAFSEQQTMGKFYKNMKFCF